MWVAAPPPLCEASTAAFGGEPTAAFGGEDEGPPSTGLEGWAKCSLPTASVLAAVSCRGAGVAQPTFGALVTKSVARYVCSSSWTGFCSGVSCSATC